MSDELLPPEALGQALGDAPRIASNIGQRTANEWAAEATMSGLAMRPGDTLIVAFSTPVTDEQAARVRDRLREHLPDLAGVCVIDSVAALAAYRPD